MRALSVKQPWAELIAQGKKKVEHRSWTASFRGPLLIVASAARQDKRCAEEGVDSAAIVYGAAVCVVDVVDVTGAEGEYVWHFANPRRAESEALKGDAGIYEIDDARVRVVEGGAAKTARSASARSRRYLVLVADGDPAIRAELRRALQSDGEVLVDLLEAKDGEAAWAMIQRHQPDLCLLDPLMPKLGGFDVLQKIRKDPQLGAIKVLVVCDRTLVSSGSAVGADACLAKPFSAEELHAAVRAVLAD